MAKQPNRKIRIVPLLFVLISCLHAFQNVQAQRPMEYLDRGLVAMDIKNAVFLSWRMLGTDPVAIGFNLYRNKKKINDALITESTNFTDPKGTANDKYNVETLLANGKTERSEEVAVWTRKAPTAEEAIKRRQPGRPFLEIPIGESPNEDNRPGEMSVGDLDGDGKYELVFMWEGNNPWLEAIDLSGKSLWRIFCGPNVKYDHMPFFVYDLDGDGKAEVACLTGPGTKDGMGKFLSKGPATDCDHSKILKRNSGNPMEDDVFITVFDGETGKELATILFWPPIGPVEKMKEVWGDNYGNRSSRIMGCVIYHKVHGPLLVYSRGIYSRIGMKAYKFDDKETLETIWTFDSDDESGKYRDYRGQGNHSLAVGDVDGDGSDEIMYGACAIDHDGTGMYTTGMGHGDSHSFGDLDPDNPGLEFFQGHEGGEHGISMRDAATGKILWEVWSKADVGRAWAADVNPEYRGAECVSSATANYDCKGKEIPTKYNHYAAPIYFDGRPQRALRFRNTIDGDGGRILSAWHFGATTLHSTKADACLVADILGDWREEVIFLRSDKKVFQLFSTWIPTKRKNHTLMHDPVYRMNIVVQNVGYNQPTEVGYYFADGMPEPDIKLIRHQRSVSKKP